MNCTRLHLFLRYIISFSYFLHIRRTGVFRIKEISEGGFPDTSLSIWRSQHLRLAVAGTHWMYKISGIKEAPLTRHYPRLWATDPARGGNHYHCIQSWEYSTIYSVVAWLLTKLEGFAHPRPKPDLSCKVTLLVTWTGASHKPQRHVRWCNKWSLRFLVWRINLWVHDLFSRWFAC